MDIVHGFTEECSDILKVYFSFLGRFSTNGNIFDFDDDKLKGKSSYTIEHVKANRCKVLQFYGLPIDAKNYDEVITSEEGKKALEKAKKIYEIAVKYKDEYDAFERENKDIREYFEQCSKIRKDIDLEYEKNFFENIMPYVTKTEQENIKKMLSLDIKDKWQLENIADPNGMYSGSFILESFNSKYDGIIHENTYEAQKARENRIKYFKLKGIDLGNDYSAYESNENVKSIFPNKMFVDRICEEKEKNELKKEKEFFLKTSNYNDCAGILENFNLGIEDEFGMDFMNQHVTCICPNVIKDENGEYTNFNILHFPIDMLGDQYGDVVLIHEILHVVELSMKETNDGKFHIKTGFDEMDEELVTEEEKNKGDKTENKYEHNIRKCELLSENLHQYLSGVVTSRLHNQGVYLIDDEKASTVYGYTSYEQMNVITKSFVLAFAAELPKAMISQDMEYVYNIFGKENLEELNSTIEEYRRLPYLSLMQNLFDRKDTELTRKRTELIAKSESIVVEMEKKRAENYQITTRRNWRSYG